MPITVDAAFRNGRIGYEASDGQITVFGHKQSKATVLARLRRKRWEAKEYAAGRYIVDWRTGEVIYAADLAKST